MKRRSQIAGHRAVESFRRWATEENPKIQMILPLAAVGGLLQEGVGHLLREAGLVLLQLVREEEVRRLAGERHQQHSGRRAHRWGKEAGYCVVDGQKVPMRRTRLRDRQNREQRLGSYELFQRSMPRLYVLDGSKALRAAVRRHAGEAVCIQRCQVHKRRNVLEHLPEQHRPAVKRKLQNAYAMAEYADAKRALEKLPRELMDLNPSAARSLGEGMEETLTVHRLGVPQREALAAGRSDRALDGIRTAGGRATVPQGPRVSGDSAAAGFLGQRGSPKFGCQRSCGCLI